MNTVGMVAMALALGLVSGGCARPAGAPAASTPAAAPVRDTDLGLAPGSVFDTPTPPAAKANDTAPGDRPVSPRAYALAPPRIPHGVADFLPITSKENACLGCHELTEKKRGEPTPIPASHYTDYRNAPDEVGRAVTGARYVCVSCHVATTDATELVSNRFRP